MFSGPTLALQPFINMDCMLFMLVLVIFSPPINCLLLPLPWGRSLAGLRGATSLF